MNWSSEPTTYLLGIGLIFLAAGILLYFFPSKNRSALYGYRTSRSRKSNANWNFSQNYAAKQMIYYGLAMMAMAPLGGLLGIPKSWSEILVVVILILVSVKILWRTENALKKFEIENKDANEKDNH